MKDSVFGERSFEVLRTWRSGRLKGLKDSIECYAKEHELSREDTITYANVRTAYRGAVRREALQRSAVSY